MRLFGWTTLWLLPQAIADLNVSHESRNILPSTFKPPQHFRNVNLLRYINLEKSYPRHGINVVVENIDKQPQSEYYIPFEQATIGRVGGLEVKNMKVPEDVGYSVEVVEIDPYSTTQYYKVNFPKPLQPKEQLTLSISYTTLSSLSPLPAQIGQTDKQYVIYPFSVYAASAYTTTQQKTKLKFPSSDVPDATTLPKELNAEGKADPQKEGTSYTYGPYGEREPGSVQEISVRYELTKPLIHSTLLEKDVEVSHWGGNVATEERHWLSNRGAALKENFNRVAYQQSLFFNGPSSAMKEMRFPLTAGSVDAYFVDDIGNVSTSHFRVNRRESNLELRPRYPLFGGWNYSFKVGWNGDLNNYLRLVKGTTDSYVLKVPFFEGPRQSEGIEYERIITRIVLPEGASNAKFETTVPLVSNSTSLYHTFMDTVGRTTLTLTAVNIVDEFRGRDLVVTYDYPSIAKFRKPLTFFAGLVAVFVASWIIGNLNVSIGKGKQE